MFCLSPWLVLLSTAPGDCRLPSCAPGAGGDAALLCFPPRSYCAYVVQRNVTCVLQDGAESYVKAEYHKCSWGPKCPGKVL